MSQKTPCIGYERTENHTRQPHYLARSINYIETGFEEGISHTCRPPFFNHSFNDPVKSFAQKLASPHVDYGEFTREDGQGRV